MRRSERYKRNLAIKKLRDEHPEYTLEEIGEKYNLTASAVHLILRKLKNKAAVK